MVLYALEVLLPLHEVMAYALAHSPEAMKFKASGIARKWLANDRSTGLRFAEDPNPPNAGLFMSDPFVSDCWPKTRTLTGVSISRQCTSQ